MTINKLLRFMSYLIFGVCAGGFIYIRLTHPAMTETQLFLAFFWQWVVVIVAVLAGIALYKISEK